MNALNNTETHMWPSVLSVGDMYQLTRNNVLTMSIKVSTGFRVAVGSSKARVTDTLVRVHSVHTAAISRAADSFTLVDVSRAVLIRIAR